MRTPTLMLSFLTAALLLAPLPGCERDPAEDRQDINEAADRTGDALRTGAEKTGEFLDKAARSTGEVVADTADAISRTDVDVDVDVTTRPATTRRVEP